MTELPSCPPEYTFAWMKQDEHNLYSLVCRPLNPAEIKLKRELWWIVASGSSLFMFMLFFIFISGDCMRPGIGRRRRVLSNGSITEEEVVV